ncbi:hypothetical protein SUNI508_14072 [Seiridium unicorne]|uniref:Uncharacterized protein n=1 Tax=Seiridium unicorne TaxID=138068 RepID=A0ABR2V3R0_9PEZI
MFLQLRSFSFL